MADRRQDPLMVRRDIDQDVERAFDLLVHYKGFVCNDASRCDADVREQGITGLEDTLRRWLPLARDAQDPLIESVTATIGNRDAARSALCNADISRARVERLQTIAHGAFSPNMTPSQACAACRQEIARWRQLLPWILRRPDGQHHVEPGSRRTASAVGDFWSLDLASRPSRLGASFFLAAACDAVAAAAHRDRTPKATLRPAIRLAHRLRESPDWVRIDEWQVVQVLDEQADLIREVEELLAEVELGCASVGEDPAPAAPGSLPPGKRERIKQKSVKTGAVRAHRPTPTAIDAAAKRCLEDALAAATDADQAYVPSRPDIAKAVSKALDYRIGVASLFGTKQAGNERVPRYPTFMGLWQKVQLGSRDARRSRAK